MKNLAGVISGGIAPVFLDILKQKEKILPRKTRGQNDSKKRLQNLHLINKEISRKDFKTILYFCALKILKMETDDLNLSRHLLERMEQRDIDKKWILETIRMPDKEDHIDDNEIHFFKIIEAFSNKCLKVVVNPKDKIIVTAHFDRIKTRKGLK